MDIKKLGWNKQFADAFRQCANESQIPARVALEHKQRYALWCEHGDLTGQVAGRMLNELASRADLPAVGDWVTISPRPDEGKATIHQLLPRKSFFSRKAVLAGGPAYGPGKTEQQVLASNIDTVFLVSGLDADFNTRRIERFIANAWDSGASPVVLLNKADICSNVAKYEEQALAVAPGIPVHAISAATGSRLELVRGYLLEGQTAAFLGSSGVGKSTIINSLLGEQRLDTGGVRLDDAKGRHTTTHRELILLPEGGVVLDTPGMRRLTLWGDETGIEQTFSDIEALGNQCRFRNCSHNGEPGCAIAEALDTGTLDSKRYKSYLKLQRENRHLALMKDDKARRQQQRELQKKVSQYHKGVKELKKRGML